MISWWEIYRSSTLLGLKFRFILKKINKLITLSEYLNNYLFKNIKQMFNNYNNIVIKWVVKYEFYYFY